VAYLTYPDIDPVLFRLGPLSVHWYGLAYVAAFVIAGLMLKRLNERWKAGLSVDDMIEVILAATIGVIVGGRLGYVLFYGAGKYVENPAQIIAVWDGGMSFHGGLAGILIAGLVMEPRLKLPRLTLYDIGAVGAPIGFGLGRLANFVNGELWGRTTDVPWAMVFPGAGPLPRHPSQLYEAFLEGILLWGILLFLARKRRPPGMLFGVMMTLYGIFRFTVEFFREPDAQLGFIVSWLTMGQLLSLPVIAVGAYFLWRVATGRASLPASSKAPRS